ncbi:MAG TPA: MarC family protein [Thermoanaerobaculia bacterium]|jgi:multiple antibiotic resistance protein|nr:MarC family protein [Thermoanaerobaculia bacterium]
MFSSAEAKFVVLAFSSLFSVINPIEAAPFFVSLTAGAPQDRRKMAVRASAAAAVILAIFALTGSAIFSAFGITLPAFQIAGGILFTSMGLRTLGEDDRPERATPLMTRDPSIVPLGMPLIAGPGAISTVMVLVGQARDAGHRAALAVAIAANILLTLLILLAAPRLVALIGETGQKIVSKIMGLITAVIGVQFILNGVETVALAILRAARG